VKSEFKQYSLEFLNYLSNPALLTSALNITIRIVVLLSKFLLTFLIVTYYGEVELGVYGIITSTIGLSVFVIGFEYYLYSARVLLSSESSDMFYVLKHQAVVHLLLIVCFLPVAFLFFVYGILDWEFYLVFFTLLLLEFIAHEGYRLLLTLKHPIYANLTLVVRHALWVPLLWLGIVTTNVNYVVHTILNLWMMGSLLSIALCCWVLLRSKSVYTTNFSFSGSAIDWLKLKEGFTGSSIFMMAVVFLMLAEILPRFVLKYYHGDAAVGTFVFFITIISAMNSLVQDGSVRILFPHILQAYQRENYDDYRLQLARLTASVMLLSIVCAIIAFFAIDLLLLLIARERLILNSSVFWILLPAFVLESFAVVPHYILYIRNQLKTIIRINFLTLIVAIIMIASLVPQMGEIGAAISVLVFRFFLVLCKGFCVLRLERL